MKLLNLLPTLLALAAAQGESEPQYRIMEHQSMEPPVTHQEFDNWETKGSAIFTKNQIVLVPEVADRRGAIYQKHKVETKDQWIVDVKMRIGNQDKTPRGGNGLAIHYLRSLNQEDLLKGQFGYEKNFDGLAVYVNNILSQKQKDSDQNQNYVQAFFNDGSQIINFMKTKDQKNCKALIRNLPEGQSFHLRIEYDKPTISIFYYDPSLQSF